ncbi:uncharacterized protein IWZ02DRAFT_159635 [Phyllosticta citriasiana]|uniref:uncharacterized protein n=1 Tax=Phyllosticta citriasiana TaxID=595635 RepID=UPI0030FDF447
MGTRRCPRAASRVFLVLLFLRGAANAGPPSAISATRPSEPASQPASQPARARAQATRNDGTRSLLDSHPTIRRASSSKREKGKGEQSVMCVSSKVHSLYTQHAATTTTEHTERISRFSRNTAWPEQATKVNRAVVAASQRQHHETPWAPTPKRLTETAHFQNRKWRLLFIRATTLRRTQAVGTSIRELHCASRYLGKVACLQAVAELLIERAATSQSGRQRKEGGRQPVAQCLNL